jgi:adenylate kinase family enzyme
MIRFLLRIVYYIIKRAVSPFELLWDYFFGITLDLTNVNKIIVTGIVGGSGKTTLSRALERKNGIPRIGLDVFTYGENWRRRSKQEFEVKFREAIKQDKYVLDGVFTDPKNDKRQELLEEVAANDADMVIHMYTPCLVGIWRKLFRSFKRAIGVIESGASTETLRNVINMTRAYWNQFDIRKKNIDGLWKGKGNDNRFFKVKWPYYYKL